MIARHAADAHRRRPERVALFVACFNDVLAPGVGRATVRLLRRLGVEVEFPPEQSCCGQVLTNSGYSRDAVGLVRRHARTFAGFDAVVVPSASCAGVIDTQHERIARGTGDVALVDATRRVAERTHELTSFLTDVLGVDDVGAFYPHRVAYHPTCHSLRHLALGGRPTRLLAHVEGLELVDLTASDECCGFGGTFAVKNAAVSTAMLEDKLDAIAATGADRCVAVDTSCLLHIGGGLRRRHASTRTVHLAEVLASTREDPAP